MAIVVGALLLAWVGLIGTAPRIVLEITVAGILLTAIVFSYQTIEVTDTYVISRFGFGAILKRLALSEISDVQFKPSSWYDGWGVRLTGRGWLYNVSGLGAVEFTMRGGGKIRFGTDDATNLIEAVRQAIPPVAKPAVS
ncbi:MAG: hypothetical protein ABIQ55_03510 [Gemmatimonadaceae bacterium]